MNLDSYKTDHNISILNRCKILITGIKSVDSFDENIICATTADDVSLIVEGSGLEVCDVNLVKGVIEANGVFNGLYYNESTSVKKSFWGLFGK
ncbi:MAG: hypothetical protein E7600_05815 [Ruminococcaceae bacterium]|nr:hypothetical protein [Oscillospiraceae bacterium]